MGVTDGADSGAPVEAGVAGDIRIREPRGRKRPLVLVLVIVLLCGGGGAAWWFFGRETNEDRYVAALERGDFTANYATPEVAIASGWAFCEDVAEGEKTQGYDYEVVAVQELCPEFSDAVETIPTPEQQAEQLTTELREKGLGGKFASDAAAVAYAESLCQRLDEGAPQQGTEQDATAVGVYCQEYAAGFKTLYPIDVKASFTLSEDDPSVYFPSIEGGFRNCSGSGGYSDISEGTEVLVKNSAGDVLTTTSLGRGSGLPPFECTFKFKFTVMDGEAGGYFIEVSDRGQVHYSPAQLKLPGAVELTMG
jgi:hypothetical protein